MPLFATLDNARMEAEIGRVRASVILAAPAISCAVAKALVDASRRLSIQNVQVVLDVSASVARLGYGEHAAVEVLRSGGLEVRHHPGLRTGVLICDRRGWSFTSTPRLVEAEAVAGSEAFNAIALTEAQVVVLRGELPQTGVATHTAAQAELPPIVGGTKVDDATVDKVKSALEIAPPQAFDLARQTQVYAALIEFVELTCEGFNLQSRRVQLPDTLPMIASKDRALKDRLSASLKVLDKIEKPKALKDITESLEELRKAYLIPVGHAGRVMLKSKRRAFETELQSIEKALADFKEALVKDLKQALDSVVASITPDLARAVLADPPPRFRGLFPATDESAAEYVREQLGKAFPSAEALVEGMRIHKFYKDVTYETLKDKAFVERVLSQIPRAVLDGALLDERIAAESGRSS